MPMQMPVQTEYNNANVNVMAGNNNNSNQPAGATNPQGYYVNNSNFVPRLTVPEARFDSVDTALMESLQNENRMVVLKCESIVLDFVQSGYAPLSFLHFNLNFVIESSLCRLFAANNTWKFGSP
jgi:hypothetical protein